jgi:hypothetical protein
VEALDAPHIRDLVSRKSWYGEAGHPISKDMNRLKEVKQTNISHIILEKTANASTVEGLVETAATHVGKDFMGLIDQGSKVAFSMRGFGKTVALNEGGGITLVTRPMRITCYDWVVYPSHESAVMKTIRESVDVTDVTFKDSFFPLSESDVVSFLRSNSDEYAIMESYFDEIGYVDRRVTLSEHAFEIQHENGKQIVPLKKHLHDTLRKML